MAVPAAAVMSAATFYSVETCHQQSPFLSLSSLSTSPLKFSTITSNCPNKRFISAKATKSESGISPKVGVAVYKPKSYDVLASDAATALSFALQEGKTRVEIEFPCVLSLSLLSISY